MADTLTLEEAVAEALQNNYNIRLARVEEQIAVNNVTRGNAGFLPSVDATVGNFWTSSNTQQQFIDGREVINPSARARALDAGIGVTWTIFDGLGMFRRYEILETTLDLQQLTTRLALRNTAADVSAAYYEIVFQSLLARALEDAMDLSRFRRDLAGERFSVGNGSRLEFRLASVDYNADSSAYLQQQRLIEQAKIQLNQLLGRPPVQAFAVTDTILLAQGVVYDNLREELLRRNLALQTQEQAIMLAELNKELIESERYPRVALSADYGYSRFRTDAGFSLGRRNLDLVYGVSASINLFNGFNLRRRLENAELEVLLRQTELSQTREQLQAELESRFTQYEYLRRALALDQENADIAQENVQVESERFRLGAGSNLETREAELQYIQARSRSLQSLYLAKLAEVELLRLTEGL